MSKQIIIPVWFCLVVSACALNIPVEAQIADGQALANPVPVASVVNEPVVASLQHTGQSSQNASDDLEPEVNRASVPAASELVGPPPLPPCPASALGVKDEIAAQICQRIRTEPLPDRLTIDHRVLRTLDAMLPFYAERGYQPAWLDANGKPLPAATALIEALGEADRDGLRPSDYQRNGLQKRITTLQQHNDALNIARLTDFDLLLTDAFLSYGSHLLSGRLSPRTVDRDWEIKPRSRDLATVLQQALARDSIIESLRALAPQAKGYVQLRDRLHKYRRIEQMGGWPAISGNASAKTLRARLEAGGDLVGTGGTIADALRRFQRRHGLAETGTVNAATRAALNVPVSERIQQIELNMERWRWLPDDFGARHILVNIPSYKMQVFEDGKVVLESKAVVGRQERQTPTFTANMEYLVMSPKWHVPRSIAVRDKLPQLQRNPNALKQQRIRIYNRAGQEINPASVNWSGVSARNFNYYLRQDAGPRNALGGIKFMFPNRHSVYLHDTPSRELFSRNQRTYSSGCIRISKPVELAEYLLKHDPKWNKNTIKTASTSGKQRVVHLPEEVPVYLLYWTAWVDEEGFLNFRDDIYKRDKPLARALYQDDKTGRKGA
ncbi:MAG: L,D-transpeptidase family protein [Candidatus Competibacteraceae bacterium]|nr:L,D-transpeptidase family protein [Candidatus Competibacteraceae bacterium]MCP5125137.1 L,D-transpeptidase family protein [Gammaproteobacteria bacterium]